MGGSVDEGHFIQCLRCLVCLVGIWDAYYGNLTYFGVFSLNLKYSFVEKILIGIFLFQIIA